MTRQQQSEICEILIEFMKAKSRFDEEYKSWESGGRFDFNAMDDLENKLYNLKNKTHLALRDNTEDNNGFIQKADLFDLIVGSIFHEALHLKEYIYTLRSYAPRYTSFADRQKKGRLNDYADDFLKHSMEIVREAETNLPKKAYEVNNLFEDGQLLLEEIIKKYRRNSRIIRTIFTSRDVVEKIYGEGGLASLYEKIYKNGPAEGYLRVGASFMKDGFYDAAISAFESAARILGTDEDENPVRGELLKKCQQLQKNQPSLGKKAGQLIAMVSA